MPHGLAAAAPLRTRLGCAVLLQHRACSSICCKNINGSSSRQTSQIVAAAAHQSAATCNLQHRNDAASIQQQQVVAPTLAAVGAAAAQRVVQPFAALSRVLLTSTNANVFRSALTQRRQPVSGPFGVLLFLATLIAASFAAIRSVLVRRGKSCKTCRGFGLQRCRLCLGSGRVDWAAKLQHFDVCPLCMNRRFVVCAECGGHYHRAMFAHRRRQAGGQFEQESSTSKGRRTASTSNGGFGDGAEQGTFAGPIVLNLAGAGAAAGGVTVVTSGIGPSPGGMASQVLSSMSD